MLFVNKITMEASLYSRPKVSNILSSDKSSRRYKTHRRNKFHSSIRDTNQEKKRNANKFRIKFLPENTNEDTKMTVIETLNHTIGTVIQPPDIISCERVLAWDGTHNPKDIVVTFKDVYTREKVFNATFPFNFSNNYSIIDELGKERAAVWAEAASIFGIMNVLVVSGVVYIRNRQTCMHKIRTMLEFRVILRKISCEMLIRPSFLRHCTEDDANVRQSSDDSLASLRWYGTKRFKTNCEKKIRIRNIPENPYEDTKSVAFQYMRSNLFRELHYSDIQRCERVVAWNGSVDPRDIVVTFKRKYVRLYVYNQREYLQNGRSIVLDELTTKMSIVWAEAADVFGEYNVFTAYSAIVIIRTGNQEHNFFSLDQFRNFMELLERNY